MILVIAAPLYNGALAIAFARGVPVTTAIVAGVEITLLAAGVALLAMTRFTRDDLAPATLAYFGLLIGVAMSLVNDRVFADGIRVFVIMGLFTMLGLRVTLRHVDRVFTILTALVLCVLALELGSTRTYVQIFEPASFYEATRGIAKFSLDKSGLFRNSLGYEGRLSLNPFSSYRTSSLFIEQVSLANFGGILVIYLLARWSALTHASRCFFLGALALIFVTNSTRTTMGLAALGLLGYWIYPRLPRWGTVAVAPVILASASAIAWWSGPATSDDLAGRVSLTVRTLAELDWTAYVGLAPEQAALYGDSGYPYLIVTTTLVGASMFWLFASLYPTRNNNAERRCAWATAIYFFANLVIGGTAVFSIKVAAPLWFLIGALRSADASPPGTVR